jgi:LytS/YehU family sensor histidine kinase
VLTASRRDWVTLQDELSFVREYVAMQTLRFGDRLSFTITGDAADSAQADCPSLLLQPLVENAIRHGVERHDGSCVIALRVQAVGDDVRVAVSNSVPSDSADNPGLGIGLTTLQERLALLYGDEAAVTTDRSHDTFRVTVQIPRSRPGS